jgi:hypothetical protein
MGYYDHALLERVVILGAVHIPIDACPILTSNLDENHIYRLEYHGIVQ